MAEAPGFRVIRGRQAHDMVDALDAVVYRYISKLYAPG